MRALALLATCAALAGAGCASGAPPEAVGRGGGEGVAGARLLAAGADRGRRGTGRPLRVRDGRLRASQRRDDARDRALRHPARPLDPRARHAGRAQPRRGRRPPRARVRGRRVPRREEPGPGVLRAVPLRPAPRSLEAAPGRADGSRRAGRRRDRPPPVRRRGRPARAGADHARGLRLPHAAAGPPARPCRSRASTSPGRSRTGASTRSPGAPRARATSPRPRPTTRAATAG